MITAIIFFVHLIFSLLIFTKKWQDENLSAGFLNVALIGILFAVGWSVSGMVAKSIMDSKGFGLYFDRDTFSLCILSLGEYLFYKMYYKDVFHEINKEK
jgi:phosphoglycerol transferase MdoB-like AlkP superfamily enzyme